MLFEFTKRAQRKATNTNLMVLYQRLQDALNDKVPKAGLPFRGTPREYVLQDPFADLCDRDNLGADQDARNAILMFLHKVKDKLGASAYKNLIRHAYHHADLPADLEKNFEETILAYAREDINGNKTASQKWTGIAPVVQKQALGGRLDPELFDEMSGFIKQIAKSEKMRAVEWLHNLLHRWKNNIVSPQDREKYDKAYGLLVSTCRDCGQAPPLEAFELLSNIAQIDLRNAVFEKSDLQKIYEPLNGLAAAKSAYTIDDAKKIPVSDDSERYRNEATSVSGDWQKIRNTAITMAELAAAAEHLGYEEYKERFAHEWGRIYQSCHDINMAASSLMAAQTLNAVDADSEIHARAHEEWMLHFHDMATDPEIDMSVFISFAGQIHNYQPRQENSLDIPAFLKDTLAEDLQEQPLETITQLKAFFQGNNYTSDERLEPLIEMYKTAAAQSYTTKPRETLSFFANMIKENSTFNAHYPRSVLDAAVDILYAYLADWAQQNPHDASRILPSAHHSLLGIHGEAATKLHELETTITNRVERVVKEGMSPEEFIKRLQA